MHDLAVASTEMFRDPTMWQFVINELFPILTRDNNKFKVWFPACISGDEIYSFAILAREHGIENNIEIIASYYNDINLSQIRAGLMKPLKLEVSTDNYQRINANGNLKDYYKQVGDKVIRDTSLIKNVHFIKQNINFDNPPQDVKLIIYRNQMIYFTQNLQDKLVKIMSDSLVIGGFLIIGVKEQLGLLNSKLFRVVNEDENIYRKI
jgi:chemotaxis protein methyltransferase CheR